MEVTLNGEKLCTAGIGSGSMSATVDVVHRVDGRIDMRLRVGGLEREEFLRWSLRELSIGDEIRIRVIEPTSIDPPIDRMPNPA